MSDPALQYRITQTPGPPIAYYTHDLLDASDVVLHTAYSFDYTLEDTIVQLKALVTLWVNEQPSENREYIVRLPTVNFDLNAIETLPITYGSARNVIYFYD